MITLYLQIVLNDDFYNYRLVSKFDTRLAKSQIFVANEEQLQDLDYKNFQLFS